MACVKFTCGKRKRRRREKKNSVYQFVWKQIQCFRPQTRSRSVYILSSLVLIGYKAASSSDSRGMYVEGINNLV